MGLLSLLIFLPLLGMLLIGLLPTRWQQSSRWITLGVTLTQLSLALGLVLPRYLAERAAAPAQNVVEGFRLLERVAWLDIDLGSLGRAQIDYFLGIDGISLVLILLTLLVVTIALLSSWPITKQPKAYFALFLLLDLSMVGVFVALDFLLFYLFYEVMLLPMFFLIGLWGGERREYAALKFFIYTLFGSVFMLLVMAGLLFSFAGPESSPERPVFTLNFLHLMTTGADGKLLYLLPDSVFAYGQSLLGFDARSLAFVVLFIGFGIKIPMVPFHTWLPDAHVEAPTPISVILAGVLLKVGGYGMLRICYGLFPDTAFEWSWWIGLLGLISVVYGALVAMAQTDLKRLVAYSSVSHMGYVLLGLASLEVIGLGGATFQMVTHGLISPLLFLLVGVVYDRVHDRTISNFSGLWQLMPHYSFFTLVGFFASLGLPGFAAFVSELMVFMGAFQSESVSGALPRWMPMVAVLGIVLGAVYYLRTYRQMFFGTFDPAETSDWRPRLQDLSLREYLMLAPLALLILLLGLFPSLAIDLFADTVALLTAHVLG